MDRWTWVAAEQGATPTCKAVPDGVPSCAAGEGGAVPETAAAGVTFDELRLAARNHAMPLEALQYDVTPVGLHYLLIHYDIPAIDVGGWRLRSAARSARSWSCRSTTCGPCRRLPAG